MAAINGDSYRLDDSREESVQLGKRKRSSSPEKKVHVNGHDEAVLQQALSTILTQAEK